MAPGFASEPRPPSRRKTIWKQLLAKYPQAGSIPASSTPAYADLPIHRVPSRTLLVAGDELGSGRVRGGLPCLRCSGHLSHARNRNYSKNRLHPSQCIIILSARTATLPCSIAKAVELYDPIAAITANLGLSMLGELFQCRREKQELGIVPLGFTNRLRHLSCPLCVSVAAGWHGLRPAQPRSGPKPPGFASEPQPPSRLHDRIQDRGSKGTAQHGPREATVARPRPFVSPSAARGGGGDGGNPGRGRWLRGWRANPGHPGASRSAISAPRPVPALVTTTTLPSNCPVFEIPFCPERSRECTATPLRVTVRFITHRMPRKCSGHATSDPSRQEPSLRQERTEPHRCRAAGEPELRHGRKAA